MPHDLAVAEDADRLAVGLEIGNHGHFGRKIEQPICGPLVQAALMQVRRGHRRAEMPDQPNEIIGTQRLPPENQQNVMEPGFVNQLEHRRIDRS
ncbi:hypothetical protein D3C83_36000 [compost metagenome]